MAHEKNELMKNDKVNNIKVLPEDIVNKISAGEVIERPSSVVKELIENSIDAKADNIFVSIKQGGKKIIEVKDNGIGMSKTDLLICTDRFTTSKISSVEDIYNIKTLGFRGEALSSIAAVSKIEVTSKNESSKTAVKLIIENDKKEVEDASNTRGSIIKVRDLFYKVPVRLKFLKSVDTETSHIYDLIFKLAIVNHDIKFVLEAEGKELLNVVEVETLKERIYQLFGNEILKNIIEIDYKNNEIELKGFISKPDFVKSNRNYQYIFVNNRSVAEKTISHALISAYGSLIPTGKYPAGILFINIDPSKIDVNIHPTKREIKFMDANLVHNIVVNALEEALKKERPIPYISAGININKEIPKENIQNKFTIKEHGNSKNEYKILEERANVIKGLINDGQMEPKIKPVLQVRLMYIIAEAEDGIYIIDQHVAHEKYLYERIKTSAGFRIGTQAYLTPISLKLNYSQSKVLNKYLKDLQNLGFDIENFGKDTFIIRGIPVILTDINAEKMLLEVVDEMQDELTKKHSANESKDNFIKSIACHSAIRAGHKLTYEEMLKLINDFMKCDLPYCPHGRPGLVKIDFDELDKKFKRT